MNKPHKLTLPLLALSSGLLLSSVALSADDKKAEAAPAATPAASASATPNPKARRVRRAMPHGPGLSPERKPQPHFPALSPLPSCPWERVCWSAAESARERTSLPE